MYINVQTTNKVLLVVVDVVVVVVVAVQPIPTII